MDGRYSSVSVDEDKWDPTDLQTYHLVDGEAHKKYRVVTTMRTMEMLVHQLNQPRRSEAQQLAAQLNGMKGGRPRKCMHPMGEKYRPCGRGRECPHWPMGSTT